MSIKALPSLTGSTSKAEESFVGALRIDYTKHFAPQQSHDHPKFALLARHWCLDAQSDLFNSGRYLLLLAESKGGFAAEHFVICEVQDVYKRKVLEERIRAVAKTPAARATAEAPMAAAADRSSNAP